MTSRVTSSAVFLVFACFFSLVSHAQAPDLAGDPSASPGFRITGALLMAPLGRKYKKLYETERNHPSMGWHLYGVLHLTSNRPLIDSNRLLIDSNRHLNDSNRPLVDSNRPLIDSNRPRTA